MDHLSKEKRSVNMSKIKSKNTKPELIIRSYLHKNGFRYRLKNNLPGKPDIYLKKYKTAIFIHGCFWHSHKNCKRSNLPKSNIEYWKNKLDMNKKRDKKAAEALKKKEIQVIVVWECEVNNVIILRNLLKKIIR
jgi:DNA mismatch endonuclease (patch repair protein)